MLKIALFGLLAACLLPGQVTISSGMPGGSVTAPASKTPPEQRCTVQGRVTNAQTGEPLKKVSVHLVQQGGKQGMMGAFMMGGGQEGYTETSAADGSFEFTGVEPGSYSLTGERSGFLNSTYGGKGPFSQGSTISLSVSQKLSGIALPMTPQGVISGRVLDQDGDPVGGLQIMALRRIWMHGEASYVPLGNGTTDEEGTFRVANLQPGTYYLVAQKLQFMGMGQGPSSPDKPDIRPVRTFYPDAASRESAAPITVSAGQNLSGMEIRLRTATTHHVRGKVAGDAAGAANGLMVSISPEGDDFPFMGPGGTVNSDHTFDIAGIAPGKYTVSAMQMRDGFRNFASEAIEVGSSDVEGVVLSASPATKIQGQILVEGAPDGKTPDLKTVSIMLQSAGRAMSFPSQAKTLEDGRFTMDSVGPGKYRAAVSGEPAGTYTASVRYGSQDVLYKSFEIGQTGSDLQVVLRYGVAEVDGTVQPTESSAGSGAPAANPQGTVILLPEPMRQDGSLLFGATDQNGTFTIKDVPPGQYKALALEPINAMLLQNPDLLKELATKGVEVEVKENDKKQVQLQLTPGTDMQQIMARLGIEDE